MKKSFLWVLMVVLLSLENILPWAAIMTTFAAAGSWFFFPSLMGTLVLLLVGIIFLLLLITEWKEPHSGVHRGGGWLFRQYRELS